jgi:hypothetical protein
LHDTAAKPRRRTRRTRTTNIATDTDDTPSRSKNSRQTELSTALALALAVVAAAGVLCLGESSEALADGANDPTSLQQAADRAGAQIENVSPATASGGPNLSSRNGHAAVSLPASGDGALTLGKGRTQIGLRLPKAARGREAQKLSDGKVAFVNTASPVQVISEQVDATSARTLVVLNGPSAPTSYRFDLQVPPGSRLSLQTNGGVDVLNPQGRILAQVAAPWAKDAAGQNVKTSYRIDGTSLVQNVKLTDHTQFPVIADPKLTYGFGVYLNLWGWEANAYGPALGILMAGGAVAVCTSSNVPAPITLLVKFICNAGVSGAAWELLKNLNDYIRSGSFNSNTCYQKKIIPFDYGGWVAVDGGNCWP